MPEQRHIQQIRVFLSSPGDVADERVLARRLLKDELPSDPLLLRGYVTFDVVSWDDPAAPIPMDAAITPQEAVNRFGPRPSECDVVVVILWARMGTNLDVRTFRKPDDEPYLSGTEWEFEDALNAPEAQRPTIFVYRRTEEFKVGAKDPKRTEKFRQFDLVDDFIKRFQNPDGSFAGGFTLYRTPTEFKERLGNDIKFFLRERLLRECPDMIPVAPAIVPGWIGSPYPGLRPFMAEEAQIFFGRGREVDALIARLRDPVQRFLAVVGSSGSGKSSLLRAGLLPRLADGAIEDSQHWPVLTFTPGASGDNPLLALASELKGMLPASAQRPQIEIATTLATAPVRLSDYIDLLMADRTAGAMLVLFIDQFEELFTLVAERHRRSFIEFLARATDAPRLRVLATLRADFLPHCAAEPTLEALLQAQAGTFVLGPPGHAALTDMIRGPAQRAGLDLEDGLADEILKDAGSDPGEALPLVAFCLEELHRRTAPDYRLSLDAYYALGGLRGAIGQRAGTLLGELRETEGEGLDAALAQVFESLVHVSVSGKAARQRASRDKLMAAPTPTPRLVEKLIYPGRLLLAENTGGRATVTLAHEALLQEWPDLRNCLGTDYLTLLQKGVGTWNTWRAKEPLIKPNLSRADLSGVDLQGADLHGVKLSGTNLNKADLRRTNLRQADLKGANLQGANLGEADLSGADLDFAVLIDTDLTDADLTGARVYGISAWRLKLAGTRQQDLIVTEFGEPVLTVDNIEVVQFTNLLLHNETLRGVIDLVNMKMVLILGRFTPERRPVRDALRAALRQRNYLPVLFDFELPAGRDTTETTLLLAHMARFIIADISDATSVMQELGAIVPEIPSTPVQTIIIAAQAKPQMFGLLDRYPWFLPTYSYESEEQLIANLDEQVIRPAEQQIAQTRRAQSGRTLHPS